MNVLEAVTDYSGKDYEIGCVEMLELCGFEAVRTGNDDKGVDIKASITIGENVKKYYIQCKYLNKTLSMHPVQEIFAGAHYHGADGTPVLITNNHLSSEARQFAEAMRVEIISYPEWIELKEAHRNKRIINPDRRGLAGILLGRLSGNQEFAIHSIQTSDIRKDHNNELKAAITGKYNRILECRKEADKLRQQASRLEQKAIIMQKEEMLKHLAFL